MTKDPLTEFLDALLREQGWDPYHSSPEQDQRLRELTDREREYWPLGILPTESRENWKQALTGQEP